MSINVRDESGNCRICIEDELTIYTAGVVNSTLRDALAANDTVAIDLTGVTEIDTAGLQILLVARQEALLRNRAVSFIGSNSVVNDCLRLLNLSHNFKFETPAALAAA